MSIAEAIIVGLVTTTVMAFIGGWVFMLMVGLAHHEWLPQLPTIGYLPAVALVTLTGSLWRVVTYQRTVE